MRRRVSIFVCHFQLVRLDYPQVSVGHPSCVVVQAGGCDFWEWHDDAPTQFLKQLLIDLRDKVRDLTRENTNLRGSISDNITGSC